MERRFQPTLCVPTLKFQHLLLNFKFLDPPHHVINEISVSKIMGFQNRREGANFGCSLTGLSCSRYRFGSNPSLSLRTCYMATQTHLCKKTNTHIQLQQHFEIEIQIQIQIWQQPVPKSQDLLHGYPNPPMQEHKYTVTVTTAF